jgi:hypothetical protein
MQNNILGISQPRRTARQAAILTDPQLTDIHSSAAFRARYRSNSSLEDARR